MALGYGLDSSTNCPGSIPDQILKKSMHLQAVVDKDLTVSSDQGYTGCSYTPP